MQFLKNIFEYLQDNFPNLFHGVGSNVVIWVLGTISAAGSAFWGWRKISKKRRDKGLPRNDDDISDEQNSISNESEECTRFLLPAANANFFERDTFHSRLTKAFGNPSPGSHIQILSGMGGVGKTQIALGFAYKSIKTGMYSEGVFWINGESKDAIKKDFLLISEELELTDTSVNVDYKYTKKLLKNWFITNKNWLLIIDNAQKEEWLSSYLPPNISGHILYITQVKQFGKQSHIPVDIFTTQDAKQFMRCRLNKEFGTTESLNSLVKRLGMFPLAMEQAITYMLRTGMPFEEYLLLLEKHGLKAFNEKDAHLSDYRHVVTTTWRISFAKMKKSATKQLFYLCAYMASENIPINLFRRQRKLLPTPLKKMIDDERSVGHILSELQSYSLVTFRTGYFNIHSMVQEAMRMQLEQKWKFNHRWKWLILALKIVARDKHQYDDKNKDEQTNLKDRLDWAAEMSTHIDSVKSLAKREEVKSKSIQKAQDKDDLKIVVIL